MNDANHIGDLNEMVVGDNDHGDALPEPKCGSCGVPWIDHMGIMGTCADNAALREDLKASLEAHDEMRQEITTQRIEIERLSAAVVKLSQSSLPENVEISILRKERDEARRMYCEVDNCTADEAMLLAAEQGWDCYEEPVPLKRKTLSESDPRIISIDELEQTIRNSQMYD